MGVDVDRSQDCLALLAVGKRDILFFLGLDSVSFSFSLALGLFLLWSLLSAPFPDAQLFKVPPHGVDHSSHLCLIGTGELMHFQVFLLDEVEPIVSARRKQMGHFLTIFASVDVKDELFPCKFMVSIEGARSLVLLFTLFEHCFEVID